MQNHNSNLGDVINRSTHGCLLAFLVTLIRKGMLWYTIWLINWRGNLIELWTPWPCKTSCANSTGMVHSMKKKEQKKSNEKHYVHEADFDSEIDHSDFFSVDFECLCHVNGRIGHEREGKVRKRWQWWRSQFAEYFLLFFCFHQRMWESKITCTM